MNSKKGNAATSLLLLAGLSTTASFAAHTPSKDGSLEPQPSRFSISSLKNGHAVLQLGGYWGLQGKSQHVNIQGLIGDDFRITDRSDFNGLFGLGYYLAGQTYNGFEISYGINGFYLAKTSASGVVTQESLFTNLSYDYHARHIPIYAMAKATKNLQSKSLALTVDAGIGPNFMKVSGFKEHSLDNGITIPDNAFSSRSSTTFSATFGAGIKKNNAFGRAALECGYRFYYLGQSHLTPASNQVLNTLQTSSAYANAIICSLSV